MKCNLTDHGIGVMLIIRGPGGFTGGQACDAIISHLDLFPTICELAGIERPAINVQVEGRSDVHEVDCLWRDARLVVQLDGFTFHRTRGDRERDAATDTDLELAGYRVMRLTWNDVTKRADRSIERVSNAL